MGIESPRPEKVRAGLPPHRWTKIDDPDAVAVVSAHSTVIAGGGPAGLTAGYELTKHGTAAWCWRPSQDGRRHLAGTDQYKGTDSASSGHRFFQGEEVSRIWQESWATVHHAFAMSRSTITAAFLLSAEPATRLKLGRFVDKNCPELREAPLPDQAEKSFEDWVVNRFSGSSSRSSRHTRRRCRECPPTPSLGRLGRPADQGPEPDRRGVERFFGNRNKKGEVIKTLIDSFQYPRLGPGQMWEAARELVRSRGGAVHHDRRVVRVEHDGSAVSAFVTRDSNGKMTRYNGDNFISTLPIRELIRSMSPQPPAEVVEAAESLKYRDFLTVVLIVDRPETSRHGSTSTSPTSDRLVQSRTGPRPRPRPVQEQSRPRVLLLRGDDL